MNKINGFSGEYGFLSNFYPSLISIENINYPTVEHAFQAAKTNNIDDKLKIANNNDPSVAKKLGRKVKLRKDWEQIKDDIMYELLKLKFNIPELKQKLLNTKDAELIEDNWWNDQYWGVCRGKGKNMLGKLLMKVRSELKGN